MEEFDAFDSVSALLKVNGNVAVRLADQSKLSCKVEQGLKKLNVSQEAEKLE